MNVKSIPTEWRPDVEALTPMKGNDDQALLVVRWWQLQVCSAVRANAMLLAHQDDQRHAHLSGRQNSQIDEIGLRHFRIQFFLISAVKFVHPPILAPSRGRRRKC